MDNIFYKMIRALDDDIELNIDSGKQFTLSFHKYFNYIGYTIKVVDLYTNKEIHSNEYHRYEFETLFDIFEKSTFKLPCMVMELMYNHEYKTFDLV